MDNSVSTQTNIFPLYRSIYLLAKWTLWS